MGSTGCLRVREGAPLDLCLGQQARSRRDKDLSGDCKVHIQRRIWFGDILWAWSTAAEGIKEKGNPNVLAWSGTCRDGGLGMGGGGQCVLFFFFFFSAFVLKSVFELLVGYPAGSVNAVVLTVVAKHGQQAGRRRSLTGRREAVGQSCGVDGLRSQTGPWTPSLLRELCGAEVGRLAAGRSSSSLSQVTTCPRDLGKSWIARPARRVKLTGALIPGNS